MSGSGRAFVHLKIILIIALCLIGAMSCTFVHLEGGKGKLIRY